MPARTKSRPRRARLSGRIQYLRRRIPSFEVPPYQGQRYRDMVPDTLDIQERIGLAVNGLTGPTDPELDHLMYFKVDFRAHPPVMSHSKSDVCTAKFMESLPLMRLASGSDLNAHVDPLWMEMALRMIGPGGLLYWPLSPYSNGPPDWCDPTPPGSRHFALPTWNGRMLGAMTLYLLRDPKGPWEATCRGIVDGLSGLTVEEEDYAYYPPGAYVPGPNGPRHKRVPWKPFGIFSSLFGWLVGGLSQFHRAAGYQPAGDLALKLSRFLAFHGEYYGPNGEYLPNNAGREWEEKPGEFAAPPPVSSEIHFQHHATPLLGMADCAINTGDQRLQEFVIKAFEWGIGKGCDLVGYFPENIDNTNEFEGSETCEVAAMIGIALKLSAAGLGDYWDHADRWIRNQFAENQLTQADWAYHMAAGDLIWPRMRLRPSAFTPGEETNDHVPERNLGAFAGWPTANDWYVGQGNGLMHCCTGNATRALYYIWEHMLHREPGRLSVNLLLNRPSRWADVHSHIPYTGQVDVVLKQSVRELSVRMPQWVALRQVVCRVNGRGRPFRWDGRYAVVEQPGATDTVTFTFPVPESTVAADIEKDHYFFTLKGSDVVDVYPRGRYCPLYQRAHYRQPDTRWREIERFVPRRAFEW